VNRGKASLCPWEEVKDKQFGTLEPGQPGSADNSKASVLPTRQQQQQQQQLSLGQTEADSIEAAEVESATEAAQTLRGACRQ
jgi:hypothetical protein